MAWNNSNHHIEPETSCSIIDNVIECVNDAETEASVALLSIDLPDDVKEHLDSIILNLSGIENEMEDIRKIASTLREQREYYKDQVDKIEEVLKD